MPKVLKAVASGKLNGGVDAPVLAKPPTKSTRVLALLQREQGATLAELVDATGWQSHTTRASLTGLRKKGHAIDRRKREDVTCYQKRLETGRNGNGSVGRLNSPHYFPRSRPAIFPRSRPAS